MATETTEYGVCCSCGATASDVNRLKLCGNCRAPLRDANANLGQDYYPGTEGPVSETQRVIEATIAGLVVDLTGDVIESGKTSYADAMRMVIAALCAGQKYKREAAEWRHNGRPG